MVNACTVCLANSGVSKLEASTVTKQQGVGAQTVPSILNFASHMIVGLNPTRRDRFSITGTQPIAAVPVVVSSTVGSHVNIKQELSLIWSQWLHFLNRSQQQISRSWAGMGIAVYAL
jgi:hypothetical protein